MADKPVAGGFVAAQRKLMGLTQEALAEQVECSAETIRKIEAGKRKPGSRLARRLATAFTLLPPDLHATFVAWVCGETLADWQIDQLLDTLPTSKRAPAESSPGPSHTDRDRCSMLEKVRSIWIADLLEPSLADRPRISLRLVEQPEAVSHPLRWQVQEFGRMARELAADVPIVEIFDAKSGELLILGGPGAGKTTLLLELARDLLDRAARDESHPIPVIFNLSSWAIECGPLAEWIVGELNTIYDVPVRLAREWMADGRVLPLLDGLDEIRPERQAACVETINAFRRDHGLVKLAICSRAADYGALGDTRLKLHGAVHIEPLALEQIQAYLARAGQRFQDLRMALSQDTALQDLARAPLILAMLIDIFEKSESGVFSAQADPEIRRRQIFAQYVDHMFARRSAGTRYTRDQTIHWLGWLARALAQHAGTIFFIERLHSGWLVTPRQQACYEAGEKLAFGFIVGVLSGVIWGLGGGLNQRSIASPATALLLNERLVYTHEQIVAWLVATLGIALLLGVLMALAVWLAARLVARWDGAASAVAEDQRRHMRSAIAIGCAVGLIDGLMAGRWNGMVPTLDAASRPLAGLGLGALTALATGLGAGFVYWRAAQPGRIIVVETFKWFWPDARKWVALGPVIGALLGLVYGIAQWAADGAVSGLVYGLAIGLCNGLVGGLIAGVMVGTGRGEIPTRAVPNQGIHRSARTALWVGCLAWLAVGLAAAASDTLALVMTYWAGYVMPAEVLRHVIVWGVIHWLIWALSFGLGAGLLNGGLACIQHGLLRWMLWRDGVIPWDYARFLNYTAERIFVRKVGGGYQFAHRLLQEYFASLGSKR